MGKYPTDAQERMGNMYIVICISTGILILLECVFPFYIYL